MTLKELLEESMKTDHPDLSALIMFLVFEKQVLTLEDDSSELQLYYLEKHRKRMNQELKAYKKKMNIKYKPDVFEIKIQPKRGYRTIYVLAETQTQAEAYCRSLVFEPISTSICDNGKLMTKYNKYNQEVHVRIRDLKNGKIPSFLGGNSY